MFEFPNNFFYVCCAYFLNFFVCVLLVSCKCVLLLLMKCSFSFITLWFGKTFLSLFYLLDKKVYSYLKVVLVGLSNRIVSILIKYTHLNIFWLTFNLSYHKKAGLLSGKGLPHRYKLLYHHSSRLYTLACSGPATKGLCRWGRGTKQRVAGNKHLNVCELVEVEVRN